MSLNQWQKNFWSSVNSLSSHFDGGSAKCDMKANSRGILPWLQRQQAGTQCPRKVSRLWECRVGGRLMWNEWGPLSYRMSGHNSLEAQSPTFIPNYSSVTYNTCWWRIPVLIWAITYWVLTVCTRKAEWLRVWIWGSENLGLNVGSATHSWCDDCGQVTLTSRNSVSSSVKWASL